MLFFKAMFANPNTEAKMIQSNNEFLTELINWTPKMVIPVWCYGLHQQSLDV